MKEPLRKIEPGETFYLFGDKIHYVGVLETSDEPVHVYWSWAKYKQRRSYDALPQHRFEVLWEYMKKKRNSKGKGRV